MALDARFPTDMTVLNNADKYELAERIQTQQPDLSLPSMAQDARFPAGMAVLNNADN
ncbi:hypothetical protein [Methylomonas sp. CM2]|uniref:hypothetical protein n=1 Tax=Methylomonas sp. CM2 TaxID=3417647 RepID=UPI003CEC333D